MNQPQIITTFVANLNNGARNNLKMQLGGGTFSWQEQKEIAAWINGARERIEDLEKKNAILREALVRSILQTTGWRKGAKHAIDATETVKSEEQR